MCTLNCRTWRVMIRSWIQSWTVSWGELVGVYWLLLEIRTLIFLQHSLYSYQLEIPQWVFVLRFVQISMNGYTLPAKFQTVDGDVLIHTIMYFTGRVCTGSMFQSDICQLHSNSKQFAKSVSEPSPQGREAWRGQEEIGSFETARYDTGIIIKYSSEF